MSSCSSAVTCRAIRFRVGPAERQPHPARSPAAANVAKNPRRHRNDPLVPALSIRDEQPLLAIDLKVFFSVVPKEPAEVTAADVLGFTKAQRQPRRLLGGLRRCEVLGLRLSDVHPGSREQTPGRPLTPRADTPRSPAYRDQSTHWGWPPDAGWLPVMLSCVSSGVVDLRRLSGVLGLRGRAGGNGVSMYSSPSWAHSTCARPTRSSP
jgi:hypothetical protein